MLPIQDVARGKTVTGAWAHQSAAPPKSPWITRSTGHAGVYGELPFWAPCRPLIPESLATPRIQFSLFSQNLDIFSLGSLLFCPFLVSLFSFILIAQTHLSLSLSLFVLYSLFYLDWFTYVSIKFSLRPCRFNTANSTSLPHHLPMWNIQTLQHILKVLLHQVRNCISPCFCLM